MEHEAFVKRIVEGAKKNLELDGEVKPFAFVHTKDNQLFVIPMPMRDKVREMSVLRHFCMEKESDFVLMISEAWAKKYEKEEKADFTTPVSQQDGRIECVIFSLETIEGGTWMGMAEIKEAAGKKTFDANVEFNDSKLEGRLTNILPDKAYKEKP